MMRPEEGDPSVVTDTCPYNPYTYIFTPIPMPVVQLLLLLYLQVALFLSCEGSDQNRAKLMDQ